VAVVLALLCAAAWGSMEVLLLRSAKDLGALRLNLWLMIFGTALIAPVALFAGPAPELGDLPIAIAPALVGLAASTLYMVALRDGMLSLVSPTVATSGGIGAVLAVLLLGEELAALQIGALATAVAGVVLATARGRGAASPAGMGWAVVSAVLFGLYTVTLAIASDRLGAVWAVVAYRITGLAVLGAIFAMWRLSPRVGAQGLRRTLTAATLETVGFVAFTTALTIGPVAVVSVIMGQFSTVAVVLATVVLRERLVRHQWVGVALMLTATAVLGATQ
jgi:drug/metabolite transporter (DMT)-like permease